MYNWSKFIAHNKNIIDTIDDPQLKKNAIEIHTLTLWFDLLKKKKTMIKEDFELYCVAVLDFIQVIDTNIDINLVIESL